MAAILHPGLVLVDETSGSRRLLTNMAENLMFHVFLARCDRLSSTLAEQAFITASLAV
jgi:hypothetical protein